MHIVLSNDDGIQARGIHALAQALAARGHRVTVSAPDRERSCSGHALSLREPLYAREAAGWAGFAAYEVSGTPADCAKLGIENLAGAPVDLMVAGINHGSNLGSDTLYSGTVSAAMEAALMGYPALAVSLASDECVDFSVAAEIAADVVEWMRTRALGGRVLNLNVPPLAREKILGIRAAPLALRRYLGGYEKRQAPIGRTYYLINSHLEAQLIEPGTDAALVEAGYCTLTPLDWRLGHAAALIQLQGDMPAL
ncbi:MAG: 5'/3'-nucleotidase SurE [Clostridia bacterium]